MWIRNNKRTAALLVGGSVLALVAVGGIAPRVGLALTPAPAGPSQPTQALKMAPAVALKMAPANA